MNLITRDTDYAIRAVLYMARLGREVSVSGLVQELNVPKAFMRRILQALSKNGILGSRKGKSGGFYLKRSPQKIYIMDFIKIFHGEVKLINCVLKGEICPEIRRCPVRKRLVKLERMLISELEKINIDSLIRFKCTH